MKNSEQDALDALIVRNVKQLNVVLSRIWYGLTPRVFGALDAATEEWTEKNGWKGEFGSAKDEELWFAPPEWTTSDPSGGEDGHYAYFTLDYRGNEPDTEGGDQDDLIVLLNAGIGSMGFRILRGDDAAVNKPKWRNLMAAPEIVSAMVACGFVHDDRGSYFLPLRFEADTLAEGILQDDLSNFLSPLNEAMEKLPVAVAAMRPAISVASNSVASKSASG